MSTDDQTRSKIYRRLNLKSLVGERDNFVSNSLVHFEPLERLENRRDMMKPVCSSSGTSCAEFNKS